MSTYSEDMEVFEFSRTMNAFKAECSGFNSDDDLAHLQQEEDTSGWQGKDTNGCPLQGDAQLPKCAFGDTRIEQPVIQPFGPCDVPVKKNEGVWATVSSANIAGCRFGLFAVSSSSWSDPARLAFAARLFGTSDRFV